MNQYLKNKGVTHCPSAPALNWNAAEYRYCYTDYCWRGMNGEHWSINTYGDGSINAPYCGALGAAPLGAIARTKQREFMEDFGQVVSQRRSLG